MPVLAAAILALQIEADALRRDVEHLASDAMEGRAAGSAGDEKATAWIAERFKETGLKPGGDDGGYFQAFRITGTTLRTRNVIGIVEGSDPEAGCLVVGAHHDHLGREGRQVPGRLGAATARDAIWNGADDNASGTAALLAIGRALGRAEARPRRSVVLVAFGAEEHGLAGSKHYAAHPALPLERTAAMVNLDMLGRGSAAEPTSVGLWPEGFWADRVAEAGRRARLPLAPGKPGASSDHVTFQRRGVAVVSFHENGVGQSDYHRPTDHADKLDIDYMTRLTRAALLCVTELASPAD